MADFVITHRIECPDLTAALNNLADALKSRSVAVSPVRDIPISPAPEKPVQATVEAPKPVEQAAPVAAPVEAATPAPVSPAPASPAPVTAAPTPAPTPAADAPAKVYTFDDITKAGSQLLEMNKMPQLMELLKGYGVQAVTQLRPEQYADVAAGLRGLGANI